MITELDSCITSSTVTDEKNYFLLPFRFERLDSTSELLVNEIGDYIILPAGSVERIVNRSLSQDEDTELFNKLLTNFFISENPFPEYFRLLETRYATKKSFLDSFTALHIVVITLRCNQDCHYCQVSKVRKSDSVTKYDMEVETLYRTIDMIFKSPNPRLTIEFQGGEPLLRFDLIKEAVEYAKGKNEGEHRKLVFVICTNLNYANEEILKYCRDNNILISTSLDGPEYLHNLNRPNAVYNSYLRTIEGINLARSIVGRDRVSALMTTSKFSLEYPEAIIDEYVNRGFNEIFLRELNPYGYAVKYEADVSYSIDEFLEFYKKALERIMEYNLKGIHISEVFTQLLLTKMLTPYPIGLVDLLSPSGIINNVLLYNHDGNIYPSDEARMLAEMGDRKFLLGNVYEDHHSLFKNEVVDEITSSWATEYVAGCSDCALQNYCCADPVRNYQVQGHSYGYRPVSDHCHKMKEIITYLVKRIRDDKNFERLVYQWINN